MCTTIRFPRASLYLPAFVGLLTIGCTGTDEAGNGQPEISQAFVERLKTHLSREADAVAYLRFDVQPLYPTISLVEQLPHATVGGRSNEVAHAGLESLGPADSRENDDGYDVIERRLRGSTVSRIRFSKRPVNESNYESVKSIVLSLEASGINHVVLRWGPTGATRIDLASGLDKHTIELRTAELAGWKPPFRFVLSFERTSDSDWLRVESLSFLDANVVYQEPSGKTVFRANREVRESIYLKARASIEYCGLDIQEGAMLGFGLATVQPATDSLKLIIENEAEIEIDQSVNGWSNHTIAISKNDCIGFSFTGSEGAVVAVGSPTIYYPVQEPPIVVLYLIDTLGANFTSLATSPSNGESTQTPALQNIAEDGVFFTNAFSNTTWTPEAVPSLFTSLHSRTLGMDGLFSKLSNTFTTLPEAFSTAGFATAAFSTNGNAGPNRGTSQGFDSFFDHIAHASDAGSLRTAPLQQILQWAERNRDRPRFLYIHTAEPHHPYTPPEPFRTAAFEPPWSEPASPISLYRGEAMFADYTLGTLWKSLAKGPGWNPGSFLVVTSDHGESFDDRALGHGGPPLPDVVRVPLVLWGPGTVPRKGRLEQNVQLIDIMPTMLDLAGVTWSGMTQGDSLLPLLNGRQLGNERDILIAVHSGGVPRLALVRDRYKLNIDLESEEPIQAFDISVDPQETEMVLNRKVVRLLANDAVRMYANLPRVQTEDQTGTVLDAEFIQELQTLGYLGGD